MVNPDTEKILSSHYVRSMLKYCRTAGFRARSSAFCPKQSLMLLLVLYERNRTFTVPSCPAAEQRWRAVGKQTFRQIRCFGAMRQVLDTLTEGGILHDRRFMSQAGRTRYFARCATRARSARRGEEKNNISFSFLFPSCRVLRSARNIVFTPLGS